MEAETKKDKMKSIIFSIIGAAISVLSFFSTIIATMHSLR